MTQCFIDKEALRLEHNSRGLREQGPRILKVKRPAPVFAHSQVVACVEGQLLTQRLRHPQTIVVHPSPIDDEFCSVSFVAAACLGDCVLDGEVDFAPVFAEEQEGVHGVEVLWNGFLVLQGPSFNYFQVVFSGVESLEEVLKEDQFPVDGEFLPATHLLQLPRIHIELQLLLEWAVVVGVDLYEDVLRVDEGFELELQLLDVGTSEDAQLLQIVLVEVGVLVVGGEDVGPRLL
eukprot:CAMPEP_0202979042 /NCGR_PEP_ID=MMETSP1396-20130829/85304_1 /ASSEMBLY_ACC=CAM_ASM_000872 /TAXON_ID= /ORGANISM="Pseudokeronopsis sp., Strain Brazil" /LENGTH=232 /DNA_ID=CAMNT_0049718299 /DNA_START=897 /DNA_END=1595 /DNA_ORIENTATION=-